MPIRTEGLNFTFQQTFSGAGGPIEDTVNDVDTFPTGLTLAQMEGHHLLYDKPKVKRGDAYALSAASFAFKGATYTMDLNTGYDGQTFAIMGPDRFATTFVYSSAVTPQGSYATSLSGHFAMGPEQRRLFYLGYI